MKRTLLAAAVATITVLGLTGEAFADSRGRRTIVDNGVVLSEHPKSSYYRKRGTQVRGFAARRGGYSYTYADSIDTYGSSRTLYGGTRFYRDAQLDRQTTSGPFDHGFFFDSGIAPRGGDSPYMH